VSEDGLIKKTFVPLRKNKEEIIIMHHACFSLEVRNHHHIMHVFVFVPLRKNKEENKLIFPFW